MTMSDPSSLLLAGLAGVATAAAIALMLPGAPPRPPGPSRADPPGPQTWPVAVPGGPGAAEGSQMPLRLAATVGVALVVLLLVGGPVGAALSGVGASVAWWSTGRMEPPAVRRRRERLTAAVPHTVDLVAACLSVGLSPAAALEAVASAVDEPMAAELAGVCHRLRLGSDPATVWRELSGHPQLGGLGRTVARAVDSGASVAEAIGRLAEDLRARTRSDVERTARAVGVKAALPLGLCLLPSFVLLGVVPLVAGSLSVLTTR